MASIKQLKETPENKELRNKVISLIDNKDFMAHYLQHDLSRYKHWSMNTLSSAYGLNPLGPGGLVVKWYKDSMLDFALLEVKPLDGDFMIDFILKHDLSVENTSDFFESYFYRTSDDFKILLTQLDSDGNWKRGILEKDRIKQKDTIHKLYRKALIKHFANIFEIRDNLIVNKEPIYKGIGSILTRAFKMNGHIPGYSGLVNEARDIQATHYYGYMSIEKFTADISHKEKFIELGFNL